jgi:hypothetical protein
MAQFGQRRYLAAHGDTPAKPAAWVGGRLRKLGACGFALVMAALAFSVRESFACCWSAAWAILGGSST